MSISLGPFMAGFLVILVLAMYIHIILHHTRSGIWGEMRLVFVCISILLLRMLVPINFPFTITLYDTKLLPCIGDVIYYEIGGIEVFTIMLILWAGVSTFLIGRYVYHTRMLRNQLSVFIQKNVLVEGMLKSYKDRRMESIRVAIIPENISPAIVGIKNPILILPQFILTDSSLQSVINHEIMHFLKNDLVLKLLIELLTCVYWWNPFVYWLKKKFFLAIEISNDTLILKGMSEEERISYAVSVVDTMKKTRESSKVQTERALAFVDSSKSHAYVRVDRILYGSYKKIPLKRH